MTSASQLILIDAEDGAENYRKRRFHGNTVVIAFVVAALILLITTVTFMMLFINKIATENATNDEVSDETNYEATTSPGHVDDSTSHPLENLTVPTKAAKCNKPVCNQLADRIRSSMNRLVNPCDDFYELACGNWNQAIPGKDISNNDDVVQDQIKNTLQDAIRHGNTTPLVRHIIALFPEAQSYPFTADQQNATPTLDQMFQTISRARKYGISVGIFTNRIADNAKNPQEKIIVFDTAILGMDRYSYSNSLRYDVVSNLRGYEDYLAGMMDLYFVEQAKLFNRSSSGNVSRTIAKDIIRFETMLAKASSWDVEEQLSLADFAEKYTAQVGLSTPFWLEYFMGAWNNVQVNQSLSVETLILVKNPRYYKVLGDYLLQRTSQQEDRRSLGNYLVWQIISAYADSLNEQFYSVSTTFATIKDDRYSYSWPWTVSSCTELVKTKFQNAITRLFVETTYASANKRKVENMYAHVLDSFMDIISQESDWISNYTKAEAIHKAKSIDALIGYDDYIMSDPKRLNEEYQEFIVSDSFLENEISKQRFLTMDEGRHFITGTKRTTWTLSPLDFNAYCEDLENSIVIPAAVMQPPLFALDYPDYWNYAIMGQTIGHEITHEFDGDGISYGTNGTILGWFDDISRENFDERKAKLAQQYSSFSLMGVSVDSDTTLNENIADNGGLKAAFSAYKKVIDLEHAGAEEPSLPGLDFSPEQLFFLGNAQKWCGKTDSWKLSSANFNLEPHTTSKFRVIGPMQNLPQFSEAFGCPAGSYMNPAQKNSVW